MKIQSWIHGPAVIALAALSVANPPAYADVEAPAADNGKALEEVIVTAEKRQENAQTVPVAVTTFNAAAISNTQQTSIADLTGAVPNLEIDVSAAGPNSANISLRGFSFQDIEKSFEPPVGVVLDGVYLSTSTGQLAQTFDFQQIEVAAGPQGTLFGKNTTGGVVNITRTKPDPDGEISGKVEVTVGNFGTNDYEAVVTAPVIPGKLAVKAAIFSQNDSGAWYDSTLGRNIGERDYQAGTFAFDLRPTDASDIYFIYDRTNDHSKLNPLISAATAEALPLPVGTGLGPFTGPFIDGQDITCLNPSTAAACRPIGAPIPSNVSTQNIDGPATYQLNAFTLNASYDFGPVKMISVTGARFSTEDTIEDYDATQYPTFTTNRPESYRQISEELRGETNFDGPFNIVAGGYYFDSDYTLNEVEYLDLADLVPELPYGIEALSTGYQVHQASRSYAVFAQGTYDFTDQWRLLFGGRQTWDDKDIQFGLFPTLLPTPYSALGYPPSTLGKLVPSSEAYLSHSWAQFSPKVGMEYKITPDAMTYFTYSRGYNSGGFNGRAGAANLLGPYGPETVSNYELGVKTDWFEHRLRLDGAIFQTNFNHVQLDEIQAGGTQGTSTTVTNGANEVIQGVELALTARPLESVTTQLNLGYLNAYYSQFEAALLLKTGDTVPQVVDDTALKPRRSPPFTVGFNTDYHVPFGPGTFGANFAMKFVDRETVDLLNDPRAWVPPTAKFDITTRYNFDAGGVNWQVQAYCKNCTDQTPINGFVTGYQGSFVEFYSQDIGRTYGVSLQANF